MSETMTIAQKEFEKAGLEMGERLSGAHRVFLADVSFSRSAMTTIGMAIKDIAERCGVFPQDITRGMQGHMYWLEDSESLIVVFPVEEIGADMLVEIPEGHWWFKDVNRHTQ